MDQQQHRAGKCNTMVAIELQNTTNLLGLGAPLPIARLSRHRQRTTVPKPIERARRARSTHTRDQRRALSRPDMHPRALAQNPAGADRCNARRV